MATVMRARKRPMLGGPQCGRAYQGMIVPAFLSKSGKTSQRRRHLCWALQDDQTSSHFRVRTVVDGILGMARRGPI